MKPTSILQATLAVLLSSISFAQAAQPKNSAMLRNIKSLTLYKDRKTTHRRVSAIPQLQCIGGSGKGHYEIDVMRCTNSGSSYDEDNIDWTCKASLPPEFKLGSTDVICEGYSSPDDPYILKGSCGVEYRLILTELGEEKYGSKGWFSSKPPQSQSAYKPIEEPASEKFFNFIFWCLFIGVGLWIGYMLIKSLFFPDVAGNGGRRGGGRRPGGGGGWRGDDDDNDPPPPYDPQPPRQQRTYTKPRSSPRTSSSQSSEPWRPGFWTGAAAAGAAGYALGNRGNRNTQAPPQQQSWFQRATTGNPDTDTGSSWFGRGNQNAGEGPSRSTRSSSSNTASEPPSSSRYESTGFGSTRRR